MQYLLLILLIGFLAWNWRHVWALVVDFTTWTWEAVLSILHFLVTPFHR